MKFLKYTGFFFLFFSILLIHAQDSLVSKKAVFKINSLKQGLQKAKQEADTLKIVRSYINLADFYKSLGLDSEAIKNYHTAQELHLKKDTIFVYVNNKIASINLSLQKYDEAKVYLNESFSIAQTIGFTNGLANANAILGSVFEKEAHYDEALVHQKRSLKLFEQLHDSTGIALTNENIGSIYEDLEHYNLALNYFNKAYEFEADSLSDLKINIINNLGDAYRKQGHYNQGLKFSEKALKLALQTANISQEESALKDLARGYALLKDFETAYKYINQEQIVSETALKQRNAELVSAMQVLYNVKESEAQLELLNKENQINKTRQYAMLFSGVALIIVFVVWLLYLKKRKRQEASILNYKQQLLQADLEKKTAEEAALKREIDIKISALTNYSLNIAHKNKLLADVARTLINLKDRNSEFVKSKLNEVAKNINFDLANDNEWTELMGFFSQIHPNFFENLKAELKTEELTASELRLCMLLRLNMSSKAIASILNITPDSVRIARYRLRKKLPVTSKDDLQAYLLNL